jgi:hypothetical protein
LDAIHNFSAEIYIVDCELAGICFTFKLSPMRSMAQSRGCQFGVKAPC